ncbi:hypothetical protein Dip510_000378 [Elusimicrobium posterum]|uniref:hypothetical protein n=1 Tax=Elusimicrobium posterum TaxID=3116653 RepID=UPI003C723B71
MKLKITMLFAVLFSAAFVAACASSNAFQRSPLERYRYEVGNAKKCNVDADCMIVPAGCCVCDGVDAINKSFVSKVKAVRTENCSMAKCNRMMCVYESIPVCYNNKCMAEPVELAQAE